VCKKEVENQRAKDTKGGGLKARVEERKKQESKPVNREKGRERRRLK